MRRKSILNATIIFMVLYLLCWKNIKSRAPTMTFSSIEDEMIVDNRVNSASQLLNDQYKNHEPAPMMKREEWHPQGNQSEEENEMKLSDSPRIIVLWTTWRSGSTYFGKLLANINNKTFYSFEPLIWWKSEILHKNAAIQFEAMSYLQDFLRCRMLAKYKKQIEFLGRLNLYLNNNVYLKEKCELRRECGSPAFVSKICQKSDLHVAKVIRLPLKCARSLLENNNLNLQILYLVRDPRAVLASRKRLSWCKDPICKDPNVVCKLLQDNLEEAIMLQKAYPMKFKMIQYEKANKYPKAGLMDIMSFLDLPLSDMQMRLLSPIKLNLDAPGIAKNASLMVERWRMKNAFEYIKIYQESCVKPLSTLGLRFFTSEIEFKNMSLPLLLSDHEKKTKVA